MQEKCCLTFGAANLIGFFAGKAIGIHLASKAGKKCWQIVQIALSAAFHLAIECNAASMMQMHN